MEAFVGTIVTSAQTVTVNFLSSAITSYWGIILSITFVMFMIGMFWKLGKFKRG